MKQKERLRRLIVRLAVADAKCRPVPVLSEPGLNRAVVRLADGIRKSWTERRYRRSDNRKAVAAA